MAKRKETMTKGERDALIQLIRRQAQVKKTGAVARSKELFADLEHQLGTIYSYDDDAVWKAATESAQEEVARAQAIVAARCKELGIPEDLAPSLSFGWCGRGANAVASRRAELRNGWCGFVIGSYLRFRFYGRGQYALLSKCQGTSARMLANDSTMPMRLGFAGLAGGGAGARPSQSGGKSQPFTPSRSRVGGPSG